MNSYHRQLVILNVVFSLIKCICCQNLPYEPLVPISCSPSVNCPAEYPCCSQFWTCGTGPVCIIGCNPKNSFSPRSCITGPAFLPVEFAKTEQMESNLELINHKKRMISPRLFKNNAALQFFTAYRSSLENPQLKKEKSESLETSIIKTLSKKDVKVETDSVLLLNRDIENIPVSLVEALAAQNQLKVVTTNYKYLFAPNMNFLNKESIDRFGPLIATSFAGDHLKLLSTNIIPWTEFLITRSEDEAQNQWDHVDFTYSGYLKVVQKTDQQKSAFISLSMPKRSAGSLLSTTRSMLYGRVGVHLKAGRGRGVITTIVLFSNVHDEIDFEFLGGDLLHAQTNYYHQGELIHTRMLKVPLETSIYENWHYYEIDWNEDRIHWYIDGKIVRTLKKVDTWDLHKNIFKYPQTPMKLHVSIWPGGSKNNSPGTINWAGGLIDWDHETDILESGEFSCNVKSISVEPFFNLQMQNFQQEALESPGTFFKQRLGYHFFPYDVKHDFMIDNVVLSKKAITYLHGYKSNGDAPEKT